MIHQVYSIAEEIKRLREERDMTQEELAESAEISLSHLSKVESGSRMIGMKTYSKILYALNAVPHYDNGNRKERNTFRFSVASIINIKRMLGSGDGIFIKYCRNNKKQYRYHKKPRKE